MVEHSPGMWEVVSSIPRYANIGLCASRQDIGLHAPRQHSCIFPWGGDILSQYMSPGICGWYAVI